MGHESKSSALLSAAENIVNYKNLYDQWIVTSTIEECIQQQYPGFDHDPKRMASSMARAIPSCDDHTFINLKGIYRFKWNKISYWYFYKNPNDHETAPKCPVDNISRQKMVADQGPMLVSINRKYESYQHDQHFDSVDSFISKLKIIIKTTNLIKQTTRNTKILPISIFEIRNRSNQ